MDRRIADAADAIDEVLLPLTVAERASVMQTLLNRGHYTVIGKGKLA